MSHEFVQDARQRQYRLTLEVGFSGSGLSGYVCHIKHKVIAAEQLK